LRAEIVNNLFYICIKYADGINNDVLNRTEPYTEFMMADEHNHLAESGVTLHSDSEIYSGGDDLSSGSNSPVILYKPPTVWSLIRGAAINLLLPFVNGMMLGFGELFAHEAAFRLGWGGTKVRYIFLRFTMNSTNNSGLSSYSKKSAPYRTWYRASRKAPQSPPFAGRYCKPGVEIC
jgi:hypothetical protein